MSKIAPFIFFCILAFPARSQYADIQQLKSLSIEELMNVEVTSVSKHKEKLATAASAICVITSEAIRRSGVTSVPEALRLAPNLQVAQVNASQWAISARGFNNVLANKLLVLIDGRVVYTPMYAGVFWDVQNLLLEDIDRIEVVSGPGGALWGANAVNGVINIITKSSQETSGLFVEAAAGNELPGFGSLRYGGKLTDSLFYRVYATAFKRGNTIYQDSVDANDNWKMIKSGVRLDWHASEKNLVTFQSDFYGGRPDPDGGNPSIAEGINVLGRWSHKVSDESGFQVQAYIDQTWRDFGNGFAEKLRTYDIEAQHRLRLGREQEITCGFGSRFMDHDVRNLELFAFFPARKSLYLHNVFLQDEIQLVPERLRVTLGVKIEHHTYAGFQFQPSVRLAWLPTDRHTVWAAVSRAVRTPSRLEREFHLYLAPGLPVLEGGNFIPEEVLAYELGWRIQPQHKVFASLTAFYNRYDNIRSAEPGPPPLNIPFTIANGVEGDTYGVEMSGNWQVNPWWQLRGGYTFLKKSLSVKPTSADANRGTAESNDPMHQFLLQSFMDISKAIELNAVIRYVDKLPDPPVSSYLGLDLKLSWKVNNIFELSMVGQNLAQPNHTEFIPASPEPKDIERSFYGKIICRF